MGRGRSKDMQDFDHIGFEGKHHNLETDPVLDRAASAVAATLAAYASAEMMLS